VLKKQFFIDSIRRCITSYYNTETKRLNADAYEKDGKTLNKNYAGSECDYSMFDEYVRKDYQTENCIMWRRGYITGLTIRGTDDSMTWLLNALASKHPTTDTPYGEKTTTGIEVHYGFHFGWMQIINDWFDFVKDVNPKVIVIEGHSRGAAIAQAAAAATQYRIEHVPITAFLWAPPRYFNKAGAISYNKRVPNTYRIVNANDPVVHVPPKYM
jgi:predicted lipase